MSLQSRSSRHHWPGPNGDPIPENEPVRPSGAAQALLAPVRKVHCAGDVSPRSSPSPTLYESLLSSPTASADELFDRQDSNTSTSDSLERCVRGGLPRLSSGLSSSMRSCYPRAKSESNLAALAQEIPSCSWDQAISNACRHSSSDSPSQGGFTCESSAPSERLVRGGSSAIDLLAQMRRKQSSGAGVNISAPSSLRKISLGSEDGLSGSYGSSSLTSGSAYVSHAHDSSSRTSFSSNTSTSQDSPLENAVSLESFMHCGHMSLELSSPSTGHGWPSPKRNLQSVSKPADAISRKVTPMSQPATLSKNDAAMLS
ncbi:hypothetical protein WJX84_006496 [Apatococcus fuscideae]|uniref:Uncharacterized protein n=1 Tax=Apatococcus fuscideae TaxID=2026836 RepID=A0AAW1T943_9CHLO